jgi:hypothetical protein
MEVTGLQLQGKQLPGAGSIPVRWLYATVPLSSGVKQVPQSPYSQPALMQTSFSNAKTSSDLASARQFTVFMERRNSTWISLAID